MKKSLAIRALKGLSAALLCCCAAPAFGGVMLVDFEMPEGVEAGDSLSGGGLDGAAVANSSSSKQGAAGGVSSDGSGGSAGGSAQGRSSSAGSSGGSGGGSGSGTGSGPSSIPTQPTGGSANNGGATPPAPGPDTGNGGVGPGGDMLVTDPVVLVSQSNGGGDNQPSVSTDPTFSYMPPLSVVVDGGGSAPSPLAANLGDPSAAVDPGASAPEASAVIIWAVLGTTAAFGCKLRRRSAR